MEKEKWLSVGYSEMKNEQDNNNNKLDTLFKSFSDNVIFIMQITQKDELAGTVLLTKNQVEELYNSLCR